MIAVAVDLTPIQSEVARQTSVVQSAITLIQSLAQQIADAANDPARVAELADALRSSSDALAAAVAQNTPSQPA